MQAHNVVEPSKAQYWSQALLTPKPPKADSEGILQRTWRFCIDFVGLNHATLSENWPLPRIDQLLLHVGQHKPKYFAKIDFTNGFYQCAIDKPSRVYTAFIVASGLFQWMRVPMGLKGAPSYFQQQMANVVLAGL